MTAGGGNRNGADIDNKGPDSCGSRGQHAKHDDKGGKIGSLNGSRRQHAKHDDEGCKSEGLNGSKRQHTNGDDRDGKGPGSRVQVTGGGPVSTTTTVRSLVEMFCVLFCKE